MNIEKLRRCVSKVRQTCCTLLLLCLPVLVIAEEVVREDEATEEAVFGQDAVFKGGESVRRYNFVEILRLEPDVEFATPIFRFSLYKNIKNNLSVVTQYSSGKVKHPDFEIDIRGYNAGFQFHDNFKWLPDTDWIASMSAGRSEITVKGVDGLDRSPSFLVAWVGLRGSLSDKLEGEVYARHYRESNGRSNEQLQAKLVYRVAHNLDAVVQIVDIPTEPEYGLAMRLVW